MITRLALCFCTFVCLIRCGVAADADRQPVKIAIVGLVHDHVRGFLPGVLTRPDVKLVGVVEANAELRAAYATRYNLDAGILFTSLDDLLADVKVDAVATFTSTFDHKTVVEKCAPVGVHVMMEKPLAVNMAHGMAIKAAAQKGGIHVIVNYETTWYPGTHAAYRIAVDEGAIGELRKIVVHDGHSGPKEIGCSEAFLGWLTDPVLNGGGALTDFGCYGANLMTWLMKGQRPESVFAVTQTIKPDVYPRVDDEATIVLTYPKAQGIIQASWNWPYGRKDMEIYGRTGQVLTPSSDVLLVRAGETAETKIIPVKLTPPLSDSVSYLSAVVRGEIDPSGLSSLDVNMVVTEILDAARTSAATGERVHLPQ